MALRSGRAFYTQLASQETACPQPSPDDVTLKVPGGAVSSLGAKVRLWHFRDLR
jgi:hypothetical protein